MASAAVPAQGRFVLLWRYYQTGIVNTAFGFGLYAALVALGVNIFVAQIVSHVCGAAFNYLTFSRYAFREHRASKLRFALSYGFNYLLGLASLAIAAPLLKNPYAAGFAALLFVSLVNFVILRRFVFVDPRDTLPPSN